MTNEEYLKAIEMRVSRRAFAPRQMDGDTLSVLSQLTEAANKSGEVRFRFIEDATGVSRLLSGRYSAIALCGDDNEKTRIKIGYWGETIVLQCVYHGLGTCWITGTYDENKVLAKLQLPKDERLYGIIVVGLVKEKQSHKEKMIYNINHKQNKPYQKMFAVCDRKLPPYYEKAMKLVERAPSDTNRRDIHFRYENGVISAYVDEPYSDKSIEFGIAQLHFNLGAASMGVKGEWDKNGCFCTEDRKRIKLPIENREEEKGEQNNE